MVPSWKASGQREGGVAYGVALGPEEFVNAVFLVLLEADGVAGRLTELNAFCALLRHFYRYD